MSVIVRPSEGPIIHHPGATRWHVDEQGHLFVLSSEPVAVYAPGEWASASRAERAE